MKKPSEIKTYTYAEACERSEDSEGFYNFFLLPDTSPEQALAFERTFAIEQGTGYNVFTGADPDTVLKIYHADIPVETLEAYVEAIVAHLQAKCIDTQFSTFRTAIELHTELCASIPSTYPDKKKAERALCSLLLSLEDDAVRNIDTQIHYVRRVVDRVKFQHYKKLEK